MAVVESYTEGVTNLNIKLYNPLVKAYSGRISNSQWNTYRPLLATLHEDHVPRSGMLRILRDTYDFTPSTNQLNTKLAQWGLQVHSKRRIDVADVVDSLSSPGEKEQSLYASQPCNPDDSTTNSTGSGHSSLSGDGRSFSESSVDFDNIMMVLEVPYLAHEAAIFHGAMDKQPSYHYQLFEQSARNQFPRVDLENIPEADICSSAGLEENRHQMQATTSPRPPPNLIDEPGSSGTGPTSASAIDQLKFASAASDAIFSLLLLAIEDQAGTSHSLYIAALDDVANMMFASRCFSLAFKLLQHRYHNIPTGDSEYESVMARLSCISSATNAEQLLLAETMMSELMTLRSPLYRTSTCGEQRDELLAALRNSTEGNPIVKRLAEAGCTQTELESPLPVRVPMRRHFVPEVTCPGNWPVACDCAMLKNPHSCLIDESAHFWGLSPESGYSAVWLMLRRCIEMIEDFDVERLVFEKMDTDATRDDFLNTLSTILGCHFVQMYVAMIRAQYKPRIPVSQEEKGFLLVKFKCEIQTMFAFASWAVEKSRQSDSIFQRNAWCVAQLEQNLLLILSLPEHVRASEFTRIYNGLFQVSLSKRQALDGHVSNLPYVADTALQLVQASSFLRSKLQHTWADPILGNRLSTDAQSTTSRASSGKSFRLYAQEMMTRRGSKASLQTMSSGFKSIFSQRSLEFSTELGYPHPPSSTRTSIAESMDIDA